VCVCNHTADRRCLTVGAARVACIHVVVLPVPPAEGGTAGGAPGDAAGAAGQTGGGRGRGRRGLRVCVCVCVLGGGEGGRVLEERIGEHWAVTQHASVRLARALLACAPPATYAATPSTRPPPRPLAAALASRCCTWRRSTPPAASLATTSARAHSGVCCFIVCVCVCVCVRACVCAGPRVQAAATCAAGCSVCSSVNPHACTRRQANEHKQRLGLSNVTFLNPGVCARCGSASAGVG
jgi:hypothetical protein